MNTTKKQTRHNRRTLFGLGQEWTLKSYLIFLSRNKVYTLINVFGLSVSMMFVILIGLYLQQEYSVDQRQSKGDRIFLLATDSGITGEMGAGSNHGFQTKLRDRYPEIESSCALQMESDSRLRHSDGSQLKVKMLFADSTFYDMFDFPLLEGDRKSVLDELQSCVITPELARQLFGSQNPIGQPVTFMAVDSTLTLRVTGVMGQMEHTSITRPDIIVRFEQMAHVNPNVYPCMNAYGVTDVYLLAKPGADLKAKENDMLSYFKTFHFVFQRDDYKARPVMIPFRELYFSKADSNNCERGNLTLVRILLAMGLFVLLFSITNYVNLTTAQASYRSREMATRRLMGSQRGDIILRLIGESLVLTAFSFAIGILLAWWLLPQANSLLQCDLRFAQLFAPANLIILLAVILLVGILSGIIPAMVISRAKPIDVVRGTLRRQSKMVLSKVFITFQSACTIIAVAASLTMLMQVRHLINAPLGYDYDNLMDIHTPGTSEQKKTFVQEVRKLPGVMAASRCNGSPVTGGYNNVALWKGREVRIQRLYGERNYLQILGVKPAKDFNRGEISGAYVSANLFPMYDLPRDARSFRPYGDSSDEVDEILGVLPDMKLGTITSGFVHLGATVIYVCKNIDWFSNVIIRLRGHDVGTVDEIRRIYKNVFKEDFTDKTPFVAQMIAAGYEQEHNLSLVVSVFAFIMMVISLLGLVAMSMYFIQQRRREMAVRKVFGSTGNQIRRRLIRSFMVYVAVAFVFAVPIVWHFVGDWLSGYSYRIQLWPQIVAAGLFCLVISFLAVAVQSWVASNENPIKHIKDNG